MNTSQTLHDAVVVAPPVRPEDIIDAHYDADTREIVVSFQDGKKARVLTTEFEEHAAATATDDEAGLPDIDADTIGGVGHIGLRDAEHHHAGNRKGFQDTLY